jgi:hypothetical protein
MTLNVTDIPAGVDVSPDQHAQERLQTYRLATVEACKLDPAVGSVQYGTIVGNGVGSEWTIVFKDEKVNIIVHYDDIKRPRFGARSRKIGYTLQLSVVQECRPMMDNPSTEPRRIGVSLV